MAMPFLHFGNMHKEKRLERASLGLSPKGNSDVTLKWTRDGLTEQSQTAAQGATGTQLGAFVLGTSVLGGSTFLDLFMSLHEGGKFRALKLGAENLNLDEDLELHSISATIKLGADSGVN